MNYTFKNHLHNYSCWTAARSVQRNFTTTDKIIQSIEASDLMKIEGLQIQSAIDYDGFHSRCCNQIIDYFKSKLNIDATYGRAAKIVAIYLKTSVIIRYSGEGLLAEFIHPPIDRILLTNLQRDNKGLKLLERPWTLLNEKEYFELINKLRTFNLNKFWMLEEFWDLKKD
jgi:hypothetical protein